MQFRSYLIPGLYLWSMQSEIIGFVLRGIWTGYWLKCDQYTDHQKALGTFGSISNPAGNLILHICGNLNHFIEKYWEEQIMSATGKPSSPYRTSHSANPANHLRHQVTVTTVLSSLKGKRICFSHTRLRLQASGCRFRQY